jgi:glycosyltransferase involved in cell wall biosynthesis
MDDASLGGGQIHVLLLARHLDPDRFRVSIACAPSGWLVDEARREGIPHHPVSIANTLRWSSFAEMRRLLSTGEFDIVHTHGGTAGFWGRIGVSVAGGSRASRPLLVHTYHGIHYLGTGSTVPSWFRMIDAALVSQTDGMICVCRSDYTKAVAAHIADPSRTVVIPYGIETEKFDRRAGERPAGDRGPSGSRPFIFGNVGRLHKQKNQERLIEAFASAKFENAELWIIGEGEMRPRLAKKIADLGLERTVRLLGEQHDIPGLLEKMDIFVLPSLWEGQPLALLEAMTAGLPVIASDVDGIADLIGHGSNGLLVAPEDTAALAGSMRSLMADPVLRARLALEARNTIMSRYTAEGMAASIGELYEGLISRKITRLKL